MYREQQVGGNCRIHSLNAFFQEPRITESKFAEYSRLFEQYMYDLYNVRANPRDFDLVNSDQNNIVCYIAKREDPGIATRYFALNYHFFEKKKVEAAIRASNFFFMYTADHIWGVKQDGQAWYTLDSLSPITRCEIPDLLHRQNVGFIVVLPIRRVFRAEYDELTQIIDTRTTSLQAYNTIVGYLIKMHNEKEILGSIETNINVCIEIIDRLKDELRAPEKKKDIARKAVRKYYEFLKVFTNGNYNDIDLKIRHLPYTMYAISQLAPYITES